MSHSVSERHSEPVVYGKRSEFKAKLHDHLYTAGLVSATMTFFDEVFGSALPPDLTALASRSTIPLSAFHKSQIVRVAKTKLLGEVVTRLWLPEGWDVANGCEQNAPGWYYHIQPYNKLYYAETELVELTDVEKGWTEDK